MTDAEFQSRVADLRVAPFREDFGTTLYDLYTNCEASHRDRLRNALRSGELQEPKSWRNPTDYERSDLTREQRFRQRLVQMSIRGGSDDHRDDLCALAYYYHNLALMGLDADAILEEVARLSEPEFGRLVRAFVKREPRGKSLEAFGLEVVQTPEGPVADRSLALWPKKPKGQNPSA